MVAVWAEGQGGTELGRQEGSVVAISNMVKFGFDYMFKKISKAGIRSVAGSGRAHIWRRNGPLKTGRRHIYLERLGVCWGRLEGVIEVDGAAAVAG